MDKENAESQFPCATVASNLMLAGRGGYDMAAGDRSLPSDA
jgi:hypothetical protein